MHQSGNIDVWVGGMAEEAVEGGRVGPTFQCLLVEQLRRLRDGDRFWYENGAVFRPDQLAQIRQANLARVLCDSGDDLRDVSRDVFRLPKHQSPSYVACAKVPRVDLRFWTECCNGNLQPATFFSNLVAVWLRAISEIIRGRFCDQTSS